MHEPGRGEAIYAIKFALFSFIRTLTVGFGFAPNLLTFPALQEALAGSPAESRNTAGGEFHPALRTLLWKNEEKIGTTHNNFKTSHKAFHAIMLNFCVVGDVIISRLSASICRHASCPIKETRQHLNLNGDTCMKKWVCIPCGYVYDPEVGDPDGGIEPGTPFEEIPENWICPVCGVDKTSFEPYDEK